MPKKDVNVSHSSFKADGDTYSKPKTSKYPKTIQASSSSIIFFFLRICVSYVLQLSTDGESDQEGKAER